MKTTVARLVSAAALIYFSLARLGETGSYFESLLTACLFYSVWWLGLNSAHNTKEEDA